MGNMETIFFFQWDIFLLSKMSNVWSKLFILYQHFVVLG